MDKERLIHEIKIIEQRLYELENWNRDLNKIPKEDLEELYKELNEKMIDIEERIKGL